MTLKIQPFAALIAVTSDWVITHVSENTGDFLDIDAGVLGHTLDHVLLDDAVHDIRGVLNATAGQNGMGRLLGCSLRNGHALFDLTVHVVDAGYVLEIEPSEPVSRIDDLGLIRGLIERLRQAHSVENVAAIAARSLRALSGFDRVVVCKVEKNGEARPIGEANMPGFESIGKTRFNATDVLPKYWEKTHSQFCMIKDIDADPVGFLTKSDTGALDLRHAISALPCADRVAFARACDAKAAFAVSIVHNGALIGLILFQHRTPLCIGFRLRMAIGLFADLFTYEFTAALSNQT